MTFGPRTLADVLRDHAERRGEDTGLGFRVDGAWHIWSWSEYILEAARAARGLAELGVSQGQHVLLLVIEPEAAARLVLGAWLLGAVPIQIGVPYRLDDLGAFLKELEGTARRLKACALVVSDRFAPAEAVKNGGVRVLTVGDVQSHGDGGTAIPARAAPADVALVQLTSGTTAQSRGVVIGHDALMAHMESMSQVLVLSPEARTAVSWLPLHHDMGLIGGLLFPLYNEFPVYLLSPLDFRTRPFAWLETLSEVHAGITAAPPSAYSIAARFAERAEAAKLDFGRLECAMVGAEPISPRVLRAFSSAFAACGFRPEAFFPVYGLAEATVAVSFPRVLAPTQIDPVSRVALERDGIARPDSDDADRVEFVAVGGAIPGSEIRIVDGRNMAVGDRVVGDIQVRSNSLMRGYFDDPAATEEVLSGGWLRTGDLGYLASGTLFVSGRRKEIIIKGGHNISPHAIEEVVSDVEGVRSGCVAALGVRSPELETEEVWVVAETRLEESEHRTLSHRIRDALKARGIAVDQIRLVAPGTLPKTTSGKIQRARVREEITGGGPGLPPR
jgi:fatty-acyl-CoA synthase